MYTCFCLGITEAAILQEVLQGASVSEIEKKLGAGGCCGCCKTDIEDMIAQHEAAVHAWPQVA